MSMDYIDNDFFKSLLHNACDLKNSNTPKNVGTAMAMVFRAKKIKSRYSKIIKFLGTTDCDTTALELQFMFYHNLYEYLTKDVPSNDVGYWKQLLTENEYKKPADSKDLWTNIFGKDVNNIKGIYMCDDGKILKQEEKQLTGEDGGFEPDFFEKQFFSDDEDQESDQHEGEVEEEDNVLGNTKERESISLQLNNEEYQNDKLIERDNISAKKTLCDPKVENPMKNDGQKIKIQITTAVSGVQEYKDTRLPGMCNSFNNTGGYCPHQICIHLHRCDVCGGEHPRSRCISNLINRQTTAKAQGTKLANNGMKKWESIILKALKYGIVSHHKKPGMSDRFNCNVCKLSEQTLHDITNHLKGKQHAAKVGWDLDCDEPLEKDLNEQNIIAIENERIKEIPLEELLKQEECLQKISSDNVLCLWCNVKICGDSQVRAHLDGKNHRNHVPGLQKDRKGCTMCIWCNVTLNSEANVISHLGGSKHKKNASRYGNKMINLLEEIPKLPGMCDDWNNKGVCHYKSCRYKHSCHQCGGEHPRLKCCQAKEIQSENETGTQTQESKLSVSSAVIVATEISGQTIPVLTGRVAESKMSGTINRSTSFNECSNINSYGSNLSVPPPGYHVPSPSPVVSSYISVPPPAPVSSIPRTPSAPDLYIPQSSYYTAQPQYIPNPGPTPTLVSSLTMPNASASNTNSLQASHVQSSYISNPVTPPTQVSSLHIPYANASDVYNPSSYIPSNIPPPIVCTSNTYIPQASHIQFPNNYIHSPVPSPAPVSSMNIPSTSSDSYSPNSAPPQPRLHNQTGSHTLESEPSLSQSGFVFSKSQIEKDYNSENISKRNSNSHSHEKVYKEYDISPVRRKRRSESKSPERKQRRYEKRSDRSNKKSDETEKRRDRRGRISSKGGLLEAACKSLMSVCDKIGILGHSLKAVLKKALKFGNDGPKIIETLSDPEDQELLLLIAQKLKKLGEETDEANLLSLYTDARAATTLLLTTSKSYLVSSKSDLERHANTSIGIVKSSTQIISQKQNSDDLTPEEKELILRITEGKAR